MNRFYVRSVPYRPLSVCLAVLRILSLIMTFASGLWCERATIAGDVAVVPAISEVHGVSGLLFSILVICHIWRRRRCIAGMLTEPDTWRQQARQHVLPFCMALFACAIVSGVAIAFGSASTVAFHVGAGLMLCLVAIVHAVLSVGRKRRL